MLRTSVTRTGSQEPYICWQCLAKSRRNVIRTPPKRLFSKSARLCILTSVPANQSALLQDFSLDLDIRQRLKQWQIDNGPIPPTPLPVEAIISTKTRNKYGKTPGAAENFEEEDEEPTDTGYHPFEQDQLADVGGQRTYLLPGDMVELIFQGSRSQELAIFVRDLGMQGQYYTMSGRWAQRAHYQPRYYVPQFIDPTELSSIIPYLPESNVTPDLQGKVNSFEDALPIHVGRNVLEKMSKFWHEADAAYLASASQMEKAHEIVAHETQTLYATLGAIASKVLKHILPKKHNGKFSNTTLYALHRHLLGNDIGIRPQTKGTLRAGGKFVIASRDEVLDSRRVVKHVRSYVENRMAGKPSTTWGPVETFAARCRQVIDESRKQRQFTDFGTLGPTIAKSKPVAQREFYPVELLYIRYMESWAGLESFNQSSTLHGIGSAILRATDRYRESELDMKTAWTFLQEIGAISPWETRHAYSLRLPNTGHRLQSEATRPDLGFTEDTRAHIRKDWADTPVFCIDDPGAHEIDDGVSIEATEIPNEYWIHVHVADPASHIAHDSPIAMFAQTFVTNVYLPDRVEPMLSPEFVQSNLSLAPNRPCLTFSAKLGAEGELLEHKISAGTINNVIYVTPSVWDEVVSNDHVATDDKDISIVGRDVMPSSTPSRTMKGSAELSKGEISDLKVLRQLGQLRSKVLRRQGGVDMTNSVYGLSVHSDGKPTEVQSSQPLALPNKDPVIEISTQKSGPPQNSPLSYIMLLAAEVCAKWCHERGVPTLYRVTASHPMKESPSDFFRRVVIPSMNGEGNVPRDIELQYMSMIGAAQPSTSPGPHATVGAEMLSKCTSPLRRYGDLLMHWQIGAALEKEHQLGHSLVGNTNEEFFPFSKAAITRAAPHIDTRERMVKRANDYARRAWFCQFFIRAWKFGESSLPKKLTFVVRHTNINNKIAFGTIPQFHFPAMLRFPGKLKVEDVKPNDELEVEVVDVNALEGTITLEPASHKADLL